MRLIKRNAFSILTFALGFLIMTFAFYKADVFPFGGKQFMNIDSWHQYYPFLQELQRKLVSGESLFYTWNMGLGTNFLLIMAAYAMSPIYFLSVFVPQEYLREFMVFATIFKIALAGGFFSYYLRKTHDQWDASLIAFGLLYAFCGYAMGYYWNIMWLDAVTLLPLVLLGLNLLIKEGKFLLYTLSLTVILLSNFHIGYMVCEFIVIFYATVYFTTYTGLPLIHFLKKTLTVAFYSLIACGLSAFILLPAFKGLQQTVAMTATFPQKFETYFSVLAFFNNALANVPPTVRGGLPNIQSGVLALFLVILYFFATSIPVRQKVVNGAFLAFLFLSFNINYLNFIWHGFHFPNELPYRFAFAFSFVVLTIAYEGLLHLEGLDRKSIGYGTFALFIVMILCEQIFKSQFNSSVYYYSYAFLAIYSVVLFMAKNQKLKPDHVTRILFAMVLVEVVLSAVNGPATFGTTDRESYIYKNLPVQEALRDIRSLDKGFYRMDFTKWYSTNDPVLYGYPGVSMFSSTTNNDMTKYTRKLGLAAWVDGNRYLYASSTPLVNGLLSVKYLMSRDNEGVSSNASYALLTQYKELSLYKTAYPLPLGFMVNQDTRNWPLESSNPFEIQELFIKHATQKQTQIFHPVAQIAESYGNMRIDKTDGIRRPYTLLDNTKGSSAKIAFTAPETKQYYLYMFANYSHDTVVSVNSVSKKYETRNGLIIDLGSVPKDSPIEVSFDVTKGPGGFFDIQLVTFDDDAYASVYNTLADEPLNITAFTASALSGTVDVKETGLLYTSIPYEKGWSATVDGQETPILPLHKAVVTLPLMAGRHTVEFKYVPYGFRTGVVISLISLIALILAIVMPRFKKKGPDQKSI